MLNRNVPHRRVIVRTCGGTPATRGATEMRFARCICCWRCLASPDVPRSSLTAPVPQLVHALPSRERHHPVAAARVDALGDRSPNGAVARRAASPMAAGTTMATARWWNSLSATDDGAMLSIVQTNEPGFRKGDRVIILRDDQTRIARPG